MELEGDAGLDVADLARVPAVAVTPGFFQLFRTPLLSGRDFDDRDQPGRLPVAIVNSAFAATHFPEGALNQRIRLPGTAGEEEWRTIIGVAPDLVVGRLEPEVAQVYLPVAQAAPSNLMIVARPVAGFESLPAVIRETLMGIDPDVPLYSVQAHDVAIDLANAQWKWMSILFSVSGGVAPFERVIRVLRRTRQARAVRRAR